MDGDIDDRGGVGTEGLGDDIQTCISEYVYYDRRSSGGWED
jgi:hypothetical protein